MEFYKNQGQGLRYHNSKSKAVSDDEKENPLNRAYSHSSGESTPPHTRHIRNLQQGYDMKVDISKFEGNMPPDNFIMPPDNFIDQITTVERIFDFKDIPKNFKVKIVAIKLRKHASIWWEHLKRQQQHEIRDCILTWEKMKRELRRKYFPDHYKQDAFMKFNNFKQKELSVEQMIARYLGGLHAELSDVV